MARGGEERRRGWEKGDESREKGGKGRGRKDNMVRRWRRRRRLHTVSPCVIEKNTHYTRRGMKMTMDKKKFSIPNY